VLLPSVLPLQEHITHHAADTIPTHRATRAFVAVSERSVTAAPMLQRCRRSPLEESSTASEAAVDGGRFSYSPWQCVMAVRECVLATHASARSVSAVDLKPGVFRPDNRSSVNPSAWSDDNSSRSDNDRTWSNGDRSWSDKDRTCDAARLVHTEDAVDDGARFRRCQGNEASN
jgi:hypothetical protein